MQKMGQQQGHKPVLEEGAVLNDAPLRSRILHVAAGHGVHLVHAGAVKACSVAVEMYLRSLLQQMIRMHSIRTRQAKDVPGMVRDTNRNWAREVRPLHALCCGVPLLAVVVPLCSAAVSERVLLRHSSERHNDVWTVTCVRAGGTDCTGRKGVADASQARTSAAAGPADCCRASEPVRRCLPVPQRQTGLHVGELMCGDTTTNLGHACRRRGAELDEDEKAKRKETVDAAKSRLQNVEAQSRVNKSLQKILPVRRFGQGRRLFGSSVNTLRGGGMPNVKAKQAGGSGNGGTAAAAGTSAPGEADGGAQRPSVAKVSEPGVVKKTKQALTMQDLLPTLRHNPVHAHSQLHYQLLNG